MQLNRLSFLLYVVCTIAQTTIAIAEPLRVAVTPFHSENEDYQAAEKGAEYAMMFFTGALEVEGIQMIERGDQSPLWDELSLSGSEMAIAWDNVDLVVRGRFENLKSGIAFFWPYTLKLEVIDVTNADVLLTVKLEKKGNGRHDPIGEALVKQAPVLLREAIARRQLLKKTPRFFPMFFTNVSSNDRLDNFELDFKSILTESLESRKIRMKSLSFGGSEDALEEQTLNWLGFTDIDQSGKWRQVADYFLWGEYAEVPSDKTQQQEDIRVKATIHWLAKDGTTGSVTEIFRVGDFEKGVKNLSSKIPGNPVTKQDSGERDGAKIVSDLLFERAMPFLYKDLQHVLENDPEIDDKLMVRFSFLMNNYARRLIFTSCLFDPENLNKQYALFHCGEGSDNPVLNGRRIRRMETWLAAASQAPGKQRMPKAALGTITAERFALTREGWWYPARSTNRPPADYQTAESTDRFIQLMTGVTAILGEDNTQKRKNTGVTVNGNSRTKAGGYADRYVSNLFFNVINSDWITPNQKIQIFKLTWSLVPDSQRQDFLTWEKKRIDRLVKEVGPEKWEEAVTTPSLVFHPSSLKSPEPPSATPPNKTPISRRPRPRYFLIESDSQTRSQPFSASPQVIADARSGKFSIHSIRKLSPHQILVAGRLLETPPSERLYESIKVYDTTYPKRNLTWASFGNHNGVFPPKPPHYEPVIKLPGIFSKIKKLQWSSGEKWGVGLAYDKESTAKSIDGTFYDLFRIIQIATDGTFIADLSPPDLNLIKNTRSAIRLADDRWVILIGIRDDKVDLNYRELAKKEWRARTISVPERNENPYYADKLHSRFMTLACNKWIFYCRINDAFLTTVTSDNIFRLDQVYSAIIDRNVSRIRKSLAKQKLGESEIERAVAAWKFSVEDVTTTNDRVFLLHPGGVSSFDPSELEKGDLKIDHLDFREQRLSLYEDGRVTWQARQSHRATGEWGDTWLWLADDYSKSSYRSTQRMFFIDRTEMKLDGILELSKLQLRSLEMVTMKDSVFFTYDRPFRRPLSGKKPIPSKSLIQYRREELFKAAGKPIQ